jgi:DnaA regulatory inactivator Hda
MAGSRQLPFDLGHRDIYRREDFFISDANRDAAAWLETERSWTMPALVIYGAAASGKTHLLHLWEKDTTAAGLTAGQLSPDLLAALNRNTVVIDDVNLSIGDRAQEEILFHLYNKLRDAGGRLVVTAAHAPKEWNFTVPDLKSRILACPAVEIKAPDDRLRAVILAKLFSDRQIKVQPDVIDFILPRIERSYSALTGIVNQLDAKALAEKRAVTIPLVKDVLWL